MHFVVFDGFLPQWDKISFANRSRRTLVLAFISIYLLNLHWNAHYYIFNYKTNMNFVVFDNFVFIGFALNGKWKMWYSISNKFITNVHRKSHISTFVIILM